MKIIRNSKILVAFLLSQWMLAQVVFAEDVNDILGFTKPEQSLPPEIVKAIKEAPLTRTIYPVSGEEGFSGQILKADELVFQQDSRLVLRSLEAPWIVIAAKKWKFLKPSSPTKIERDRYVATRNGGDGGPGANGANGKGEVNRQGNPGAHGMPGESGKTGESMKLPIIYLVAGEITSPDGEPKPGFINLNLIFKGINSGNGGRGGSGGNGGKGAPGKEGATSAIDCKEGPGRGGKGGNAGQGGKGGRGGDGGNGADIVVVSTQAGLELFSYANIINIGGLGGSAGVPGRVGVYGAGGRAAGSNGWCKPGEPGSPGDYLDPVNLGTEGDGIDGGKGTVTAIQVINVNDLFK
ncbi:hypothetical protein [Pseudomonas protegens]|uniref:hypothetical protein n=1 Tax=Pseudomonas protegens TaxID=380021 RepID=UPI001A924F97|nr:hypothetical protein [Pseudomonas protegens]BCT33126.1 hypothetical protein PproGo58_26210 [Pseudomonas protegens]